MKKILFITAVTGFVLASGTAMAADHKFRISCKGQSQFDIVVSGNNAGDARRQVKREYPGCKSNWLGPVK